MKNNHQNSFPFIANKRHIYNKLIDKSISGVDLGWGFMELRYKHGFEHLFNAHCRHCLNHGTEFDFEYFHGSSSASRKAQEVSRKA